MHVEVRDTACGSTSSTSQPGIDVDLVTTATGANNRSTAGE